MIKISRKVVLKIRLDFEGKFNIRGQYEHKLGADIPALEVLHLKHGWVYYIPGSSLKGILRKAALNVAPLLGYNVDTYSVSPNNLSKSNDIVSSLFGKPGDREPKLFVDDIYIGEAKSTVVTHVKIDDKSGISYSGGLFDVEYLTINEPCYTRIYGYGLDKEEFRLLIASLAEINNITVGFRGHIKTSIIWSESLIPSQFLNDEVVKILKGVKWNVPI